MEEVFRIVTGVQQPPTGQRGISVIEEGAEQPHGSATRDFNRNNVDLEALVDLHRKKEVGRQLQNDPWNALSGESYAVNPAWKSQKLFDEGRGQY